MTIALAFFAIALASQTPQTPQIPQTPAGPADLSATAQIGQAERPASPATPAVDPNEVVCRNIAVTGRRIPTRVCETRAQMEATTTASQAAVQRTKDSYRAPPVPSSPN